MKHTVWMLAALLLCALFALPASAGSVSVMETQRQEQVFTEDGEKTLLSFTFQSAVVKIEDAPEAEEKIGASLKTLEDETAAEWQKMIGEWVEFRTETLKNGNEWYSWYTAELRRELTAERVDDRVISFRVQDYEYTGGAHGMYGIGGITFDARTGDQLALADLSETPDEFREVCIAEIIQQCQSVEGLWWYDEPSLREAVEPIVDRDSWYLTDEGIVFHSSPYELGPYAIGAVEFTVAYDLLLGLSFLQEFSAETSGS